MGWHLAMLTFNTKASRLRKRSFSLVMGLAFFFMASCIAYGRDAILILRPLDPNFDLAYNGLIQELNGSFEIKTLSIGIETNTTVQEVERVIKGTMPKLAILMDGSSIKLYREYQKAQRPGTEFIPSLVLMAAFAEKDIQSLKNSTGIRYEIQGISSFVHVRALLVNANIKRVGVLYVPDLAYFFERQKKLCEQEHIELIGIQIEPVKPSRRYRTIAKSLKKLREQNVDAIWIPHDSEIFDEDTLEWGWRAGLSGFRKPIVVGLLDFIKKDIALGQFAVVPDHKELGSQAAEMVYEIQEAGWSTERIRIAYPIGFKKIVNLNILPKSLLLDQEKLREWDNFFD